MKEQITVREAITDEETKRFWHELGAYHDRDIFPDEAAEEREYFHGEEYRAAIEAAHERQYNRCFYLFFERGELAVGFALAALFDKEDGKLFILEFCVLPEYRGGGTGHGCAEALLDWVRLRGMKYAELNCSEERRVKFWARLGFAANGYDEWGEPLMLLPPDEELPFTVEMARELDCQLMRLQNGYRADIGEAMLDEAAQKRLKAAIDKGSICFFLLKRGYRSIGMCSAAPVFSSFECKNAGIFEDFYIEPAFRRCGGARLLAQAAQEFCHEQGFSDLSVCCAPCDEAMYRALGFTTRLGSMYANI